MNNHILLPADGAETMSSEAFAAWGLGRLAYVHPLKADEARNWFPEAPTLGPDQQLYALLGADGTPLLLTDSDEAARAFAFARNMQTFSTH